MNKSGYGGISIASDYELIPIQKMRNESPRRKCGRSESVRGMHDYSSFSGQPRLSERAMKRPSDKFYTVFLLICIPSLIIEYFPDILCDPIRFVYLNGDKE